MDVMKPTLMVGAARVPMQYPDHFFPHMSFRGRYLTGVKDDLCVRAILVSEEREQLLFISLELGDIGNQWLDKLEKLTGIPASNIYLTVTHTHAAPHVGGHWPEDVADVAKGEEFSKLCWEAVRSAVTQAMASQVPAVMRYGTGVCNININRDFHYTGDDGSITVPYIQAPTPDGISDKTVYIIAFDTPTGMPVACLFSYAVHSNVTFYQSWDRQSGMEITGDIAGVAMRYVEQRQGGVAAFCLGAAADQSPMFLGNHRVFDKSGNAGWEYYGPEASYTLMDAQGSSLGAAVMNAMQGLQMQADSGIQGAQLSVNLCCKLDGHKKRTDAKEKSDSYAAQYKEKMEADFSYIADGTLDMPLYLTRLHGVNIVGVPAEIVTTIGRDLRCAVTEVLGGATIVFTQCNDAYSYISDDEGYEKRTFEALASHFMPGSAGRLVAAVRQLAKKLKESQ